MEVSLPDVVNLLSVPEATISRWVRQGYIPCTYRNGEYYFNPVTLKSWAKTKQIHIRKRSHSRPEIQKLEQGNLFEAINLGGVYQNVQASDKESLFQEIENRLALPSSPHLSLASQLMKRESLASTVIGNGVAIPHPQYPTDWGLGGPAVGTFYLESPLDFNAIDKKPIWVLFTLLSPSSQIHLQLLSQLAQILRESSAIAFIQQRPNLEDLGKKFKEILEKNH